MALPTSVLVLSFLLEVFLLPGSGESPLTISVAEGEPISFECFFNGFPTAGDLFYEIIWMYQMTHENTSKRRILAFRDTFCNVSAPVSIAGGHFRGQLDLGKNTSSLIIPEVQMNDSGLYSCDVSTVPFLADSRTNETYYLIVTAPVNKLLITSLTAGLLVSFLIVLGLYFTLKHRIKAKKPEVSLEESDLISSTPALAQRESITQPVGNEIIYSKLQWSEYSMVSSLKGSAHSCEPVTEKSRVATSDPGGEAVYAKLQRPLRLV